MSAALSQQIIPMGGLGSFNAVDLGKKLTGKVAGVTPTFGETTEGLSGSSSPKDIETMFQLTYLTFTAPRLDSVRFEAFKDQVTPFLANRGLAPNNVFADTVQVTMSQRAFRARPISPETFAEVDPAKALAFYRDRFADASDFTFVIVGNVDTLAVKPMVETWLASLPNKGRKEKARDTGMAPPKGVVKKVVYKGTEQKATTSIIFTGSCRYTPEARFLLRALTTMMQTRLNESLRERLGGTYSPNIGGGCQRQPREQYSIQIGYGSSPENVEPLTAAVMALIDSVKTRTPSQADVDKVKEEILRAREVEVKTNAYWLGNIAARDQAGEDLAGLGAPYDEMVRKLTGADLQRAARLYFNIENYARFVLLPEKPAGN
jgi:zinc protease